MGSQSVDWTVNVCKDTDTETCKKQCSYLCCVRIWYKLPQLQLNDTHLTPPEVSEEDLGLVPCAKVAQAATKR